MSITGALGIWEAKQAIYHYTPLPGKSSARGGVPMHQYEDLLVDALLDRGFSVDEALRLIELQNRLERDRREAEERRRFTEWMARISENRGADG